MSPPTSSLDVARAVSTIGLGVTTGIALCLNIWILPSMYAPRTVSPRNRLNIWSGIYDRGKTTMITTLPTIGAVRLWAAVYGNNLTQEVGYGVSRRSLLIFSALAALSIIPYTLLVMGPGINTLKKVEAEYEKGSVKASETDTDAVIATWTKQHIIRVGLLMTATVAATIDLVYF